MPDVRVQLETPVADSFRVRQVAGLFDVPVEGASSRSFAVDVPAPGGDWTIGAIVGPSGSGKTTVARAAFPGATVAGHDWPADAAVVDGFGEAPIKRIVAALTAVGFSSPPAWVRPYRTLSNGERFRCDLARALLDGGELVVFDEFTSVVDRTAARIGSAAAAKFIRSGRAARHFVAVSCHYDILEWLCPDWVVDMATCQLARGCLRRPGIELEVFRCRNAAWRLFERHHYLSGSLHHSAQSYLGTWRSEPVAFAAVLPMTGRLGRRRVSRIVVLPDYQGVGVGSAMLECVCGLYAARGERISITTGHPGMVRSLARSPSWRLAGRYRTGGTGKRHRCRRGAARTGGSLGRSVASFAYVAAARESAGANRLCSPVAGDGAGGR